MIAIKRISWIIVPAPHSYFFPSMAKSYLDLAFAKLPVQDWQSINRYRARVNRVKSYWVHNATHPCWKDQRFRSTTNIYQYKGRMSWWASTLFGLYLLPETFTTLRSHLTSFPVTIQQANVLRDPLYLRKWKGLKRESVFLFQTGTWKGTYRNGCQPLTISMTIELPA